MTGEDFCRQPAPLDSSNLSDNFPNFLSSQKVGAGGGGGGGPGRGGRVDTFLG